MIVSLWVLVVQARPLNLWKEVLVGTMIGLGALAFIVPWGRSFFNLFLPPAETVLQSLAIGAAGAAVVEMAVRMSRRVSKRS
jgi:hypothetical protein